MLTKIRKGTDSVLVKIILALIALSFIGVGGASFVNGNNGGDIVTFSKADSISMKEFQIAKAKEIEMLQNQNSTNLTEENIAKLGIDDSVIQKLINESMIKYLANYYDFDISEDLVISSVKKQPIFKNEDGEFDLNLFKNIFRNAKITENEYLQLFAKQQKRDLLLYVFMHSFNPSKMMTENIVNYMSETRIVDLLSINLDYKPRNYTPKELNAEELEDFYQSNQSLFVLDETRSFSYIKADEALLSKKLEINDDELRKFFEENLDAFAEKDFTKAKKQVNEMLVKEKLEELKNEFAKNLEEDVASGLTLVEIGKKYNLKINSVNAITMSDMNSSPLQDYAELTDFVFELNEGETSYPLSVSDKNEILMVEVKEINQSRQQPLAEVVEDIKALLYKKMLTAYNLEQLKKLAKNYDTNKINKEELKAQGIDISVNQSFTREDVSLQNKLPNTLMNAIFALKQDEVTQVFGDSKKAYAACLKIKNNNDAKAKEIRANSSQRFSDIIKGDVFEELISYLKKQNKINFVKIY